MLIREVPKVTLIFFALKCFLSAAIRAYYIVFSKNSWFIMFFCYRLLMKLIKQANMVAKLLSLTFHFGISKQKHRIYVFWVCSQFAS